MGQGRLSNLALLHVEREYVNEVISQDMEKMNNTFGQNKSRNNYFF